MQVNPDIRAAWYLLLGLSALSLGATGWRSHPADLSMPPLAVRPVDLNTATAEDLEALPRIGPSLARRILALRERHARFRRAEELLDVPGIGIRTLAVLRPWITIRDQTTNSTSASQ